MSEKTRNWWRRGWDLISGGDIKNRGDEPAKKEPLKRPLLATPDPNYVLFERLNAESRVQPYTRRVKTDVLQGTKLVDEIIWLMFNLERPSGGSFLTTSAMLEALNQRALATTLRVFYIYVDEKCQIPPADVISDTFYERLADLIQQSTSLYRFINDRFALQNQQTRSSIIDFDADDPNHRKLLINLLRCQFSVCLSVFPTRAIDHVFIVGRTPLHDIQEIGRFRFKQLLKATGSSNQDQPDEVYLAVTVKAAGRHENNSLRFNAHRFGQRYDNSPQREYNLFVGNWRTDWEFSIGAAEHDEIYHPAMAGTSARVKLNNLQIDGFRWTYRPSNTNLPAWITIHYVDATRTDGEGIRLCFVKPPILDNPLLNVMNRRQFRQEISFIGRVLPRLHSQFSLQQFNEVADPSFRNAVRPLTVTAAIEVKDSLWLLNTKEGVLRIFKNDQNQWKLASLENGAAFQVGETEYRWQATTQDLFPERFVGALTIYPSPREAPSYKKQLNVDKDAEGFLVAHNREFSTAMNPDLTLGELGVVRIKCVEVSDDGRGKYALIPVDEPTNPFFAFQPVYPREKGWPQKKVWLVYDEGSGSDLQRDEESGQAIYGEERILAEEHSYHLIGGTSLFQLKVSGTPYIGSAVAGVQGSPSPAIAPAPLKSPAPEPDEFTPTPLNIEIRLLNTAWAAYEIEEADQSNFAAHFKLLSKRGPMHFLKAYFPHSVGSAKRESAFYNQYRERAFELFLSPPDILRLNDDDPDEAPWALVFPLLDSYERFFPTASQARIAQAAAVGFGMASLLSTMADDRIINFDIDVTQLCFDSNGRLVIVDFDNTFPILVDPHNEEQVAPLLSILREGRLPAKNPSLPPEARALSKTYSPEDRKQALASIGPAFSTYMLAVILLQLLKAGAESPTEADCLTVLPGVLVQRAVQEGLELEDVQRFEDLLREMLRPASHDRPPLAEVVTRLRSSLRALSGSSEIAKVDCVRLLSSVP